MQGPYAVGRTEGKRKKQCVMQNTIFALSLRFWLLCHSRFSICSVLENTIFLSWRIRPRRRLLKIWSCDPYCGSKSTRILDSRILGASGSPQFERTLRFAWSRERRALRFDIICTMSTYDLLQFALGEIPLDLRLPLHVEVCFSKILFSGKSLYFWDWRGITIWAVILGVTWSKENSCLAISVEF